MRTVKFFSTVLLLCIVFTTFTGCASLRTMYYGAEFYGYVNKSISSEFAENNKLKGIYALNDPERENAPVPALVCN